MNKVWITAVMAGLMLTACSSSKDKAPAPELTPEQAMQQCEQAGVAVTDKAALDACMKEKGFERPGMSGQAPAAPMK